MSLTDELDRLHALHREGGLSADEFARAKERLLIHPAAPGPGDVRHEINSLRRSRSDRWIAGVCGGLGAATGLDAWAWRLGFAVVLLFGGAGLLLYALLWIFVPSD